MSAARALSALFALSLVATEAHAGGFTPWGGPTGDMNLAVSPYFFVGPDGTMSAAPYLFIGATDHFDMLFGYTWNMDPTPLDGAASVTSGAIEIMPRGFINPYIGFGLHALYVPGADVGTLGVELNGTAVGSIVGVTYNVGWWPTLGGEAGFDPGSAWAIIAPEVYVDRLNIFVEFNPTIPLAEPAFALNIVPGVGVAVDKDKRHFLTAAATIGVAPEYTGVKFGLLYNHTISLKGKKAEAAARVRQHTPTMQSCGLSRF